MSEFGEKLIHMMFRTAKGPLTAAEALSHREFVLTRSYEAPDVKAEIPVTTH